MNNKSLGFFFLFWKNDKICQGMCKKKGQTSQASPLFFLSHSCPYFFLSTFSSCHHFLKLKLPFFFEITTFFLHFYYNKRVLHLYAMHPFIKLQTYIMIKMSLIDGK